MDGHKVSTITSFSENPNFGKCLVFSITPTKLSLSGRQVENTLASYTLVNQVSVGLFSVTESNWHEAASILLNSHLPKHASSSQIACDL